MTHHSNVTNAVNRDLQLVSAVLRDLQNEIHTDLYNQRRSGDWSHRTTGALSRLDTLMADLKDRHIL